MKKAFIIFGTLLCLTFSYVNYFGISVWDSMKIGKWGPGGPGTYHK